jgi:arginase family enzyme
MLYKMSSHTKVVMTQSGKKLCNHITKKAIHYSNNFVSILPKIFDQQLNKLENDLEKRFLQLIAYECLYRGLIVPAEIETPYEETEYLRNLFPFESPEKGFFNQPITDYDALRLKIEPSMVFVGIPCDLGSPRPGSRFGPELLRERSLDFNFRSKIGNALWDISTGKNIFQSGNFYDLGNVAFHNKSYENCIQTIKDIALSIPFNNIPLIIGGDHSFSFPIIEATYEKRAKPFTVIQLDSHLDIQVWGKFKNFEPEHLDPINHGNFISWVHKKMPELTILQIGVFPYQSIDDGENQNQDIINYLSSISKKITNLEILSSPTYEIEWKLPHSEDVYLTIDVDVLNSFYVSQTGFPSPTGLNQQQFLTILKKICLQNNIIGVDLMEFGSSDKRELHYNASTFLTAAILEIIKFITEKTVDKGQI